MSGKNIASFDADAKTREQTDRPVTIGGKVFHPAARTGNVAKRLARLGAPPDNDGSSETLEASMDYLYNSLTILLVAEEDGHNPELEWLLDTLPWDIAQELVGFLNPEMAEGEVLQNSASPTVSSTTTTMSSPTPLPVA